MLRIDTSKKKWQFESFERSNTVNSRMNTAGKVCRTHQVDTQGHSLSKKKGKDSWVLEVQNKPTRPILATSVLFFHPGEGFSVTKRVSKGIASLNASQVLMCWRRLACLVHGLKQIVRGLAPFSPNVGQHKLRLRWPRLGRVQTDWWTDGLAKYLQRTLNRPSDVTSNKIDSQKRALVFGQVHDDEKLQSLDCRSAK